VAATSIVLGICRFAEHKRRRLCHAGGDGRSSNVFDPRLLLPDKPAAEANRLPRNPPCTKCRENQPNSDFGLSSRLPVDHWAVDRQVFGQAHAARLLLLLDATRYHNQIVKDHAEPPCGGQFSQIKWETTTLSFLHRLVKGPFQKSPSPKQPPKPNDKTSTPALSSGATRPHLQSDHLRPTGADDACQIGGFKPLSCRW